MNVLEDRLAVAQSTALEDRAVIMAYIGQDKPVAALKLDADFEEQAEHIRRSPKLYKAGRTMGTREIGVRPFYVNGLPVRGPSHRHLARAECRSGMAADGSDQRTQKMTSHEDLALSQKHRGKRSGARSSTRQSPHQFDLQRIFLGVLLGVPLIHLKINFN